MCILTNLIETIYMCILTNLIETIYMCILTNLIETISTCILANVVKKTSEECKLSEIFVVVEANEILNKPDLRKKKGDLKGSYYSCF
jgi:hypothetical protein